MTANGATRWAVKEKHPMTEVTNVPEPDITTGFRDVDRTGDPGDYMRLPEGVNGVERIRQLKRRS